MHKILYDLESDEKVILVVRQHPISLIVKILVWLAIAILPFIVEAVIADIFYFMSTEAEIFIAVMKDLYLLFALVGLLTIISLYYLNVHVVTDRRVIDIDQLSVTSHHTVETRLENIQDVSANVKGVWGHIFNFGFTEIQSAGSKSKIIFERIANPKVVKRVILDQYYQRTRKKLHDEHQSAGQ